MVAGERDRPDVARRRAQWIKYQGSIDPSRLVFIDETWTKTNMAPLRGWAPCGSRLIAKVPHRHWQTTTLLAALRHDGITVVNYDLPWNPQRIEQRIGRCHRYGQQRGAPDGNCDKRAALYTDGRDAKDPLLSPAYGDMPGFPPAIPTTGSRDLLLSSTVRVHRKLRQAGVEAILKVFEGQSHAQYLFDPSAPETKEAFEEIALFFDTC